MGTPAGPSGSAAPGAVGPAVIAGHVQWGSTRGAFRELATLARGDVVVVRREDGTAARFAVTRVRKFRKAHFPTGAVYGATDHAALRLITCGGRFETTTGRYPDNVVVFARMVSPRD